MTDTSASMVASELHSYMLTAAGDEDGERICRIMDRLCAAPSQTAEDALAVTVWIDGFLAAALEQLPATEMASTRNPRFLVALSRVLARRAIAALENTTGTAAESFDCQSRPTN